MPSGDALGGADHCASVAVTIGLGNECFASGAVDIWSDQVVPPGASSQSSLGQDISALEHAWIVRPIV